MSVENKTIGLKVILKNLKDEPIKNGPGETAEELTIGEAIANLLIINKVDPLRSLELARKCYSADSIELTNSEQEFIKTAIKNTQSGYTSLILGQILELLK